MRQDAHAVFLAEVHGARAIEGMPLTYDRGRMGRFAFTEDKKTLPL